MQHDRAEALLRVRYSPDRFPSKRCTATSKRSGERCRRCARPGWTVCHVHGAGGRNALDRQTARIPNSPRNLRNREIKAARSAARALIRDVPTDVEREFARFWAHRVPNPDHERFLLLLWARIEGSLDTRAWIELQQNLGLLDQT